MAVEVKDGASLSRGRRTRSSSSGPVVLASLQLPLPSLRRGNGSCSTQWSMSLAGRRDLIGWWIECGRSGRLGRPSRNRYARAFAAYQLTRMRAFLQLIFTSPRLRRHAGDPLLYLLHDPSHRLKDTSLSPLRRPASKPSTPMCSSRSGHSIA
jgi:hypothetical protein